MMLTPGNPNPPGVIEVTIALKPVICGTEINITQSLVEPNIPG